MLAIFDLDGTLVDRHCEEDAPEDGGMVITVSIFTGELIAFRCYLRPGALDEIRELLSNGNEVAIWSYGNDKYVNACADAIAAQLGVIPWKFVWSRDDIYMHEQFKNLERVTAAFANVNKHNILFIDNQSDQTEPNKVRMFRTKLVPTFSIEDKVDLPPMIGDSILEFP